MGVRRVGDWCRIVLRRRMGGSRLVEVVRGVQRIVLREGIFERLGQGVGIEMRFVNEMAIQSHRFVEVQQR